MSRCREPYDTVQLLLSFEPNAPASRLASPARHPARSSGTSPAGRASSGSRRSPGCQSRSNAARGRISGGFGVPGVRHETPLPYAAVAGRSYRLNAFPRSRLDDANRVAGRFWLPRTGPSKYLPADPFRMSFSGGRRSTGCARAPVIAGCRRAPGRRCSSDHHDPMSLPFP
jgi:hypothetical protein